jgi:hypothetical protein
MSLSTVASVALTPTTPIVPVTTLEARPANADEWDKERTALYQQLDEKVNE